MQEKESEHDYEGDKLKYIEEDYVLRAGLKGEATEEPPCGILQVDAIMEGVVISHLIYYNNDFFVFSGLLEQLEAFACGLRGGPRDGLCHRSVHDHGTHYGRKGVLDNGSGIHRRRGFIVDQFGITGQAGRTRRRRSLVR